MSRSILVRYFLHGTVYEKLGNENFIIEILQYLVRILVRLGNFCILVRFYNFS